MPGKVCGAELRSLPRVAISIRTEPMRTATARELVVRVLDVLNPEDDELEIVAMLLRDALSVLDEIGPCRER